EAHFPFSPAGIFTMVSYGIPYFNRLNRQPGAKKRPLVAQYMPRLLSDHSRFALEEAVPAPTDVIRGKTPAITRQRYNVPVTIERNVVLFTFRSASLLHEKNVAEWLRGSGRLRGHWIPSPPFRDLFQFTSSRLMFVQIGLPRKIADAHALPYAGRIHPQSPMWMGFADQNVTGAGPARITTFQGNSTARVTTAKAGDYFDNGSIQHLSHVIEDLEQWYFGLDGQSAVSDVGYGTRCGYMYRVTPVPNLGFADQLTDGGGPAFLETVFQGTDDAARGANGIDIVSADNGEPVVAHLPALQRPSHAPDGTPMHTRMEGPGFDSMDVPDGSTQPKLQFSGFFPSADFFATMRRNQAALDLVEPATEC